MGHVNIVEDQSDPDLEVIKCSTQLSMKFKPLINTEIAQINGNFRFNLKLNHKNLS